jgi:hypothetical protein
MTLLFGVNALIDFIYPGAWAVPILEWVVQVIIGILFYITVYLRLIRKGLHFPPKRSAFDERELNLRHNSYIYGLLIMLLLFGVNAVLCTYDQFWTSEWYAWVLLTCTSWLFVIGELSICRVFYPRTALQIMPAITMFSMFILNFTQSIKDLPISFANFVSNDKLNGRGFQFVVSLLFLSFSILITIGLVITHFAEKKINYDD